MRGRFYKFISFILIFVLIFSCVNIESVADEKPSLNNPVMKDGVSTWDTIWFGHYKQVDTDSDGSFDKELAQPIKWRVLSVSDNVAVLLSDKSLDCVQYSNDNVAITWDKSYIRSWLNGYDKSYNTGNRDCTANNFIDAAFTDEEQDAIITTDNLNSVTQLYQNVEGGKDTSDKIYLPSINDMSNLSYGFSKELQKSKSRYTYISDYAENRGASLNKTVGSDYFENGIYWLRTAGSTNKNVSAVTDNGTIDAEHYGCTALSVSVRPMLKLDLTKSVWSYAGTVLSSERKCKNEESAIYTVRFDANGGKVNTLEKKVNYEKIYGELPVPSYEDFIFVGWSTDKSGNEMINSGSIVKIPNNHQLYAIWKVDGGKKPLPTVIIDFEGEAPIPVSDLVYNGESQELIEKGNCAENCTLYYSFDDDTYVKTIPTAKNAGNYTIYYKIIRNDGAESIPRKVNVLIAKKLLTENMITVNNTNFYNGELQTVSFSVSDMEGGHENIFLKDYACSGTWLAKEIGEYEFCVYASANGNYYGSVNKKWEILQEDSKQEKDDSDKKEDKDKNDNNENGKNERLYDEVVICKQKMLIYSRFTNWEGVDGYRIADKRDKKYATVSKKGVLSPKKEGIVTIEAYVIVKSGKRVSKNAVASYTVRIVKPILDYDGSKYLNPGDQIDLNKYIKHIDGLDISKQKLCWKSMKKKIANVDYDTGILTVGNNKGTTKIFLIFVNADGKKFRIKDYITIKGK